MLCTYNFFVCITFYFQNKHVNLFFFSEIICTVKTRLMTKDDTQIPNPGGPMHWPIRRVPAASSKNCLMVCSSAVRTLQMAPLTIHPDPHPFCFLSLCSWFDISLFGECWILSCKHLVNLEHLEIHILINSTILQCII